jgi:hypothetical protein
MKIIWIVRKHPPYPYSRGNLEAFTIHGQYPSRVEAKAEADKKNKRSNYLYTVYGLKVKEFT